MTDTSTGEIVVRKDVEQGAVEVSTGDGWETMSPTAARKMADAYEDALQLGVLEDTKGVRPLVNILRRYADDVE